jgi:acetyl-CoA acyltransferase
MRKKPDYIWKNTEQAIETIAKIAVKHSMNGSFNPYAQYQKAKSLNEIMGSRIISDPLRLYMCSPLSDGAAAAILCSKSVAKLWTSKPIVFIKSSVVLSGKAKDDLGLSSVEVAAEKAYNIAGIMPSDVDVVEVHDAAVPGELWAYEQLKLFPQGDVQD